MLVSPQASSSSKKRGVELDVNAWKGQVRDLLRHMITSRDSEPFRQPVDLFVYPVRLTHSLYLFVNPVSQPKTYIQSIYSPKHI